jgi:hypothetical protein
MGLRSTRQHLVEQSLENCFSIDMFINKVITIFTASLYRIVLCFTLPGAESLGIRVLESIRVLNSGARKLPNGVASAGIRSLHFPLTYVYIPFHRLPGVSLSQHQISNFGCRGRHIGLMDESFFDNGWMMVECRKMEVLWCQQESSWRICHESAGKSRLNSECGNLSQSSSQRAQSPI